MWPSAAGREAVSTTPGRPPSPARSSERAHEPGSKKGAAAGKQAADAFAASVPPIVRQMQAAGLTTLAQIAEALNARGIHTARGGQPWARLW